MQRTGMRDEVLGDCHDEVAAVHLGGTGQCDAGDGAGDGGGDGGFHLHRLDLGDGVPGGDLLPDGHYRGDAAAERGGDVPGAGRVGLFGGGSVGLDRAVADGDRAEVAVD